jgi:putative oxidoreductase
MTTPSLDSRLNIFSAAVISLFRIVIGFLFTLHGCAALFGWPFELPHGAAELFSWPGWWSGFIELVTGLLVMVGLFTRPAAFLASGTMAVAYFWMHQPKGLLPQVNGGEPAVLFCFSFFLLVFIGPGSVAIESLVRRKR